jgi:antitoxin component YwqK of YwqJK toxin-antitoxin module
MIRINKMNTRKFGNYSHFFILSLLILFTDGCTRRENIVTESKYPDGSPQRVCVYRGDPSRHDLVRETIYYPNKQIQVVGEYKAHKRDGRWVFYYENGKVWSEGFFKAGQNDGKRLTYFENGRLRYEAYYDNGERIGKWKFYDESGKFLKEVDYSRPVVTK